MTDSDAAIEQFLDAVDAAFEEYDQGYADADATLRVVRTHVDDLRDAVDS
ncbi:hypothetical protein [Halapricum hydrolyticum]|uniref:Uncharacterized protein n=1 Tax=Halapricum hydrolyticum TaxID=2979991 RepID=A0AAE3LE63_9EURY|nr:hypothetical protein [Halapricum hydrolyticum]MCU4717089.1 hypothetical protein [Halapricum hydrolyticum]MCU4726016.1 hypothetical protein [Halapricum hydrolyticum]